MCFDEDAHPPALPPGIAGGAGDGEVLTLEAADGNRLAVYAARTREEPGGSGAAGSAPRPGMVVIPDVRGLVPYYEELALRFAEAGIAAVAVDLYGRTAGPGPRAADWEYREHVAQTTREGIAADVAAAVRHLRGREMAGDAAVFSVGFCFGGRASFLQAAEGHGLAGVIGFYGFPTSPGPNGIPAPIALVDRFESAVLALYGGADQGIPPETPATFDRALEAAGVDHESVTYPDAPHSFFDKHQERFAAASDDAWRRILAFVARHTETE
jgi:carboxymethylenebutenolidase